MITLITLYFKNLPMFPDVRLRLMKHTNEQFIQDYIAAAGYADAAFKK